MELAEPIETINKSLIDLFGIDTVTGLPIWRVVFSEDQYEHRHGTYDDFVPNTNIWLRTVTETRYVPKYKQWIHSKYILERLVVIPGMNASELPDQKLSYEPLWVFQDRNENYLPPKIMVCKIIIDTIYASQAVVKAMIDPENTQRDRASLIRYADPENSTEASLAMKKERVDKYIEELFGDESGLNGTTHNESSSAIIVPSTYERRN